MQSSQVLVGLPDRLVLLGVLQPGLKRLNQQEVKPYLCWFPENQTDLKHQLVGHSEGPVQFSCQVVDLFLELLGVG